MTATEYIDYIRHEAQRSGIAHVEVVTQRGYCEPDIPRLVRVCAEHTDFDCPDCGDKGRLVIVVT